MPHAQFGAPPPAIQDSRESAAAHLKLEWKLTKLSHVCPFEALPLTFAKPPPPFLVEAWYANCQQWQGSNEILGVDVLICRLSFFPIPASWTVAAQLFNTQIWPYCLLI